MVFINVSLVSFASSLLALHQLGYTASRNNDSISVCWQFTILAPANLNATGQFVYKSLNCVILMQFSVPVSWKSYI